MKTMKHILIDTNAWMIAAEVKLDLFSEVERVLDIPFTIAVLPGTIQELGKIEKEQPGKYRRAAKLALAIIRAKNLRILSGEGYVDDLLVRHSQKGNIILTQDQELKRRLSRPYLTIRQKKKVIVVR